MDDSSPFLVVGLGNPGQRYCHTRHNVGYHVLDQLARQCQVELTLHKRSGADAVATRLETSPVIFGRSRSFMNESGRDLGKLAKFYSILPQKIIVIHDDLDLPFGRIRLKHGGGEGGHNGLRSLTAALGTSQYCRLRVGIGRPPAHYDVASFVLAPFSQTERAQLPDLYERAVQTIRLLMTHPLSEVQNRIHPQS